MGDRIVWNRRPGTTSDQGSIDELVIRAATVHVEQMDRRCWWIGVYKDAADGPYWAGHFVCDKRGNMRFVEQENGGIDWASDEVHDD